MPTLTTFRILAALTVVLGLTRAPALAADKPADNTLVRNRPIPPVPPRRDTPLDRSLQALAKKELKAELASGDALLRAHAVEAAQGLPRAEQLGIVSDALKDADPMVRFAGAMSIGDQQLAEGKPAVLAAVNDPDVNVRVAVRYALHRLGDKRFTHDLEQTLADPERGVRGNTAVVLGRLGEPSAAKLLRVLERDPEPAVRLQAAESLWRLGEQRGLETLIATTLSAYPDDQMIAYLALAGPRDQRVRGNVEVGLSSEYIEIGLAAARSMGDLNSDLGYGIALEGAASPDPRQRYLAAMALASIARPDSQDVLGKLLRDKDSPDVRIAAAGAIVKLAPK